MKLTAELRIPKHQIEQMGEHFDYMLMSRFKSEFAEYIVKKHMLHRDITSNAEFFNEKIFTKSIHIFHPDTIRDSQEQLEMAIASIEKNNVQDAMMRLKRIERLLQD